jgi:putative transposase
VAHRDRHQPAALSDAERTTVLEVLSCEEYAHLSVGQAFYRYWDTGRYIASRATWYRIARDHAMVGDRRRQATASPKKIPELSATGPSQVWSWDITKLKGPRRGQYWHLYVIVDIYSRYVTGWALHHREDGALAQDLIAAATAGNGKAPHYLHSDNGSAMTSKPVIALTDLLGVTLSFSRPKVSNDNPYSEALFKTIKYDLSFPETFDSYDEALTFCRAFFTAYNTEHRHSGLGYHTPHNVHHGTTGPVTATRRAALDNAWRAHPERHLTRPRPPRLPQRAHINNPNKTRTHLSQTG